MSERTGNWKLHLQVLQEMVPFLAAAGHNSYTKYLLLYLHRMSHLDPSVSQIFEKGLHVVRRSDRYWAGLSSDLVIEQVLMRSLKTTAGLTRGRVLMKFRGSYGYSQGQCVRKSILLCKSSPSSLSQPANNTEMYDLHDKRGIPKTQTN